MNKYLVIGIVAIVIIAGGWWYFNNQSSDTAAPNKQNLSNLEKPSTHTTSGTNNEITGWKTYTSKENHYSLQIPSNWQVNDKVGVFIGVPGEVAFFPHPELLGGFGMPGVYVTVSGEQSARYDLNTQQQYEQWLSAPISANINQHQYKVGNMTIAGIPAVQYVNRTLEGDATEPFYGVVTWFRYNGQNYNIEFAHPAQDELTTYNTILSTFQFSR